MNDKKVGSHEKGVGWDKFYGRGGGVCVCVCIWKLLV